MWFWRFKVREAGKIIDKESLLVLYDKSRQQAIDKMLKACGLRFARVKPAVIFRNFQFAPRQATLPKSSEQQLEEIVAALINLQNKTIEIHGHTDTQPFKGYPREESDRLNIKLSKKRATAIAKALIKRGIQRNRIKTYGHGYHNPLVKKETRDAWRQNRRVEIKVD